MAKKIIVIDPNGQVVPSASALVANITETEQSFKPSNYASGYLPLLVDVNTADVFVETTRTVTGNTAADASNDLENPVNRNALLTNRKQIASVTEQVIGGTRYGSFIPNELVFQSNIQPEVVNFYAPSGLTATEYNPTIGVTGASGFLGTNAAQFKGSYLDLETPTAGLSLPAFSSAGTTGTCFLISGFLMFETTPSTNYDPILIARGVCGAAGIGLGKTGDSFSLEYDSDSGSKTLKFYFSHSSHTNAGYSYSMNVSPAGGVTLGQWHHFAVSWINAGSSAAISSYWNGNLQQKVSTIAGNIRNTEGSVYVGCGVQGYRPLKGWLDDVVLSIGSTNGGNLDPVRGFRGGSTGPYPTAHQDAGYYTIYYLSMDGPEGSSLFPCDTTNKIVSNVAVSAPSSLNIYSSIGVTASRTWTTPITGVCGGHAVSGGTIGYIFGYDSKACFIPTSVTDLTSGLTAAKQIRKDLMDYTFRYYLGFTAMNGSSGASGDFVNLYSGSTFPTTWTYFATEDNVNFLKNVYDGIVVAGTTAETSMADGNGAYYSFVTAAAVNLYKDVLAYFNRANSARSAVNTSIDAQTTYSNLKRIEGITQTNIASKLAASGNGVVYIRPVSSITGTNRSPENYWNLGVEKDPVEVAP